MGEEPKRFDEKGREVRSISKESIGAVLGVEACPRFCNTAAEEIGPTEKRLLVDSLG